MKNDFCNSEASHTYHERTALNVVEVPSASEGSLASQMRNTTMLFSRITLTPVHFAHQIVHTIETVEDDPTFGF